MEAVASHTCARGAVREWVLVAAVATLVSINIITSALVSINNIELNPNYVHTAVLYPDDSTPSTRSNLVVQQDQWIDYEQFRTNQLPTFRGNGIPSQEEWLLGDRASPVDSSRIPKQVFKINILDHGYLQAIFDRSISDLNMSVPQDRAIFNLQKAHQSWHDMNPGFDIRYFNLHAIRMYLRLHFHPIFLRAFDCLEAYASKCDFFRYLLLYREGGWYSDWKQVCLEDGLLDLLSEGNTTWFSALDSFEKAQRLGLICHQNAFIGATPKHPVLANVIAKVLDNIQSKHYGVHVLQATGPCVFGLAIVEEGYGVDMVNTSRIGYAKWHWNPKHNVFRYQGRKIMQHKCNDCGVGSDYDNGNNYWNVWKEKQYYCSDAASLLGET
jgi:hypothetical protein